MPQPVYAPPDLNAPPVYTTTANDTIAEFLARKSPRGSLQAAAVPDEIVASKQSAAYRAHSYHTKVPPEGVVPFEKTGATGQGTSVRPSAAMLATGIVLDGILSPGEWDDRVIEAGNAIKDHHTYYFYYHGIPGDNEKWGRGECRIGVATATHPVGPWTKQLGKPALDVGAEGEWDSDLVACLAMLKERENEYYMFFSSASPL